MRTGFTVSAVGHLGLIALAIVGVGMARPFDPAPVESISVDLISIEEFSNIRRGTLDSTIVETETPAVVDDDTPAELAQPTGNTEEDQPTPEETAVVTPAPTQQTAPEPVAEPEPIEEVLPEPEPEPEVQPEPAPEPEPVEEPEPVAPAPELATPEVAEEPAEIAPQPAIRVANLEEKRAAFRQKQEDEKKKREAEEKRKKEEEAERQREAKLEEQEDAQLLDDIANLINTEESRGATTGEGGVASLGKESGQAATLSQSEMAALQAVLQECYNPPMGAVEDGATARILITFTRDRGLALEPEIVEQTGGSMAGPNAEAGKRAIRRCVSEQRFTMLRDENYDEWREVRAFFDPSRQ